MLKKMKGLNQAMRKVLLKIKTSPQEIDSLGLEEEITEITEEDVEATVMQEAEGAVQKDKTAQIGKTGQKDKTAQIGTIAPEEDLNIEIFGIETEIEVGTEIAIGRFA